MNRRPLEAAVRSGIARPAGTAATDTDAIVSAPDARRAHATRGNRSTRRPHRFYMVMGVTAILIAAAGFGGSFGAMVSGRKTFTLLVHIHAAVFSGWLVLYLVQAGLVAAGRTVRS